MHANDNAPVHKHSATVVFVARYSPDDFAAFHEVIQRYHGRLLLRQRVDGVNLQARDAIIENKEKRWSTLVP